MAIMTAHDHEHGEAENAEIENGIAAEERFGRAFYGAGFVHALFPSLSVEREFNQALSNIPDIQHAGFDIHDEVGLDELNQIPDLSRTLYAVFQIPANISIAREMCWFLRSAAGIEIARIEPQTEKQLAALIQALNTPPKSSGPLLGLIGRSCSGLQNAACGLGLPSVEPLHLFVAPVNGFKPYPPPQLSASQIHSGIATLQIGPAQPQDSFSAMVQEILQLTNNAGFNESDRALNYLLLTYPPIYTKAFSLMMSEFLLRGVRTEPFDLIGGAGRIRLIFNFFSAQNNVSQAWFQTVDVSSPFPLLVGDLQRFIGRN